MSKKPKLPWQFIICLLGASYYFYETILEIIPSTLVNPLMTSFHLTASQVGWLDSCYFSTYALMQIIGGMLLDKFGARRIMPLAAGLCGLGLFIFASTNHYFIAILGRTIAGFGGAFGLMGAMFIVSQWIQLRWVALGLSLTIMVGLSGGLLEAPLTSLVVTIGWRSTIYLLSTIAFIFLLFFILVIRDNPERTCLQQDLLSEVKAVIGSSQNWYIAIFEGLIYIITGTLGSLWGINFLKTYYPTLSSHTAAAINSMIFLGWILGSPISGWLSDVIYKRKPFLVISSFLCILILLLITYETQLSVLSLFLSFLSLGLLSSFSGLCYAMGCELNPKTTGTAIGFINMLATLPTLFAAPLFGWLLDCWQSHHNLNNQIYSLNAYQHAMILEYGLITVAFLLALFFIKESLGRATRSHP